MKIIKHDDVIKQRYDSYELSNVMIKSIIGLVEWIGHKRLIPSDPREIAAFAKKWFDTVVVDNTSFPVDIPIYFVMRQWKIAINNSTEYLPKESIVSYGHSMKKFLDDTGVDKLRYLYLRQKPASERPKELKATNTLTPQEIEAQKRKTIEHIKAIVGDNYEQSTLYQAALNLFSSETEKQDK